MFIWASNFIITSQSSESHSSGVLTAFPFFFFVTIPSPVSLFVQLLLVICCHIVSLPVMLLTFCWYSLFSQCSLNNYSHCTWNKLSQILSVKAFVGVMRQNECCVTGPRGFQRRRTMSHGKTKVAVFYEIAVIWDKNTLPWFGFAFFFVCYYCNSPSPSPRITSATTQPTDYYKVAWTLVIFTIYCVLPWIIILA